MCHTAPLLTTRYLLLTALTAYYHLTRVSDSIFYSSLPTPGLFTVHEQAAIPTSGHVHWIVSLEYS